SIEETDAPLAFLLATEFRQAVNVAHLVGLAQQLSQRRKLPVDGRIAVAVLAQPADQEVERVLSERAELATEQKLVELTDEEGDTVFVRSIFPQQISHSRSPYFSKSSIMLNSRTGRMWVNTPS